MNREMRIISEVSDQAEAFYDDAVSLGDHAAQAFQELGQSKSRKREHRAQMTGLETVAESTLKTTDVFDYIKKQTARSEHWRKVSPETGSPNKGFGQRLKDYLEGELATKRNTLCAVDKLNIPDDTDANKKERRRIHLLLMRQFIRKMVVQYEFRVSVDLGEGADDDAQL